MDDYRRIARSALVPSLITLLALICSILVFYGLSFGQYGEVAGGAFMALVTALLAPPVLRNSAPRPLPREGAGDGPTSLSSTGLIVRAALLVLCAAALSCVVLYASLRPVAGTDDAVAEGPAWSVREVDRGRHALRAVMARAGGPDDRAGLLQASFPPDAQIRAGDTLEICTPLKIIGAEQAASSSYHRGLARAGIRYTVRPGGGEYTITHAAPCGLHERIRTRIDGKLRALFGPRHAALLAAFYFGDDRDIDMRTMSDFKRAGVLHIIAASGFNVGLVAAFPFILLAPLRVPRRAILAATLPLLAFYLYLTDMPVSLVRAFVMFAVYAAQRLFRLERNLFNTLWISGTVILGIWPHELYSPSFQMSFGATLGIIGAQRVYASCLPRVHRWLRESVALSLAAQAPVFPVVLAHMAEVGLAGALANVVVIPATVLATSLSIGAAALSCVWEQGARFVALAVGWVFELNGTCVRFISSLGLHFTADDASAWLILPFLLYLAPLVTPARYRKAAWAGVSSSFVFAALMLAPAGARPPEIIVAGRDAVLLHATRGDALVYGALTHPADARLIESRLREAGAQRLTLCVTGGADSLPAAEYLGRRFALNECVLDDRIRVGPGLRRFTALLEREGVRLHLKRLDPVDPVRPESAALLTQQYAPAPRANDAGRLARTLLDFLRLPSPEDGPLSARMMDLDELAKIYVDKD